MTWPIKVHDCAFYCGVLGDSQTSDTTDDSMAAIHVYLGRHKYPKLLPPIMPSGICGAVGTASSKGSTYLVTMLREIIHQIYCVFL